MNVLEKSAPAGSTPEPLAATKKRRPKSSMKPAVRLACGEYMRNRMMRSTSVGVLLIFLSEAVLFVVGYLISEDPYTLRVFPSALSFLPFPFVLYPILRAQAGHDPSRSRFRQAIRAGELMVRWGSLLFAAFFLLYAYFYVGWEAYFSLISAAGAAVWTWIVGVAFSLLCAWLIAVKNVRE